MGAGGIAQMIRQLREQIEQRRAEQAPVIPPQDTRRHDHMMRDLREIAPRYTGHPYRAVRDMTTRGRAGNPQDLAWWMTYGAGPESTFFEDNSLPTLPPVESPGGSPSLPPALPVPAPQPTPPPGPTGRRLAIPRPGLRIPAPLRRARGGPLSRFRGRLDRY